MHPNYAAICIYPTEFYKNQERKMKKKSLIVALLAGVFCLTSCQGVKDKILEHRVKKSISEMFEEKGMLGPGDEVKDFKLKERRGDKYHGILTLSHDTSSVEFNVSVDNSSDSLSWQIENMLKMN